MSTKLGARADVNRFSESEDMTRMTCFIFCIVNIFSPIAALNSGVVPLHSTKLALINKLYPGTALNGGYASDMYLRSHKLNFFEKKLYGLSPPRSILHQ